jgi:hypothetical protein
MNIEINLLEAASELAHEQVIRDMLLSGKITTINDIYVKHDDGTSGYTEDAQDIFNNLYDHYYNLLNSLA